MKISKKNYTWRPIHAGQRKCVRMYFKTSPNTLTLELNLLLLGIDIFFWYQYFSIPGFTTKFRYRYFSIPDHYTHFKNRYFPIPKFWYQSQVSIPKYRYPLRYFSIPSKYWNFCKENFYFLIKTNHESSMKHKNEISDF